MPKDRMYIIVTAFAPQRWMVPPSKRRDFPN
jgi:hypothetical protein